MIKSRILLVPIFSILLSSCNSFNVQNEFDNYKNVTGYTLPSSYVVNTLKTDSSKDSSFVYIKLQLSSEYHLEYDTQCIITYKTSEDYNFDIEKEISSLCNLYHLEPPPFEKEYDYVAYLTINNNRSRFVDYFVLLENNKTTLHYFRDVAQWKHGNSYHM